MSRFFLHIRDGDTLIEDQDGSELPDLEAARAEALENARHLLADELRAGRVVDGRRFEIVDEAGTLLAVVPLKDAIRLE